MINTNGSMKSLNSRCLTDLDLYRYVSRQGSAETLDSTEAHLACCDACRRNLAGLLEILHPEENPGVEGVPEPSAAELDQALGTIRRISANEQRRRSRFSGGMRYALAAAAAIGFVAVGILLFRHVYESRKSEAFFAEGRKALEQSYTGASQSRLRLTLPFSATSTIRNRPTNENLRVAENLFYQALAFREDKVDARLGLACIYLNESKYSLARDEFQKVLNIEKDHLQALIGHGVAGFELAAESRDPLRRSALLRGALEDFNAALQREPHSAEARYNKIWTLYESGMHPEALREIDAYLSREPDSTWAEELRGLKVRMQATKVSAVETEVLRAAIARDASALMELARQAPYQMPAAILSAIGQSFEAEPGGPDSVNMRWAAETMESAYSAATGDRSLRAPLDFYIGLSPPQRTLKQSLDKELQTLGQQYRGGDFTAVLQQSTPLAHRYAGLGDFWQLASLHHLRGNAFYLGRADFVSAEVEFRRMLEIADRVQSLDYRAKALASLAMICGMQRRFDESLHYAGKLKALGEQYNLDPWRMYAGVTIGNQYRHMGQFEQSQGEYASAVQMAYRLCDGRTITEILEYLGASMEGLDRIREAKAYYDQALFEQDKHYGKGAQQTRPETKIRRLNLIAKKGDLALRSNDLVSAEGLYREVLTSNISGLIELEGRSRVGLTEIFLKTNRVHDAEDMLKAAMQISRSGQYPDLEWRVHSLNGKLLERKGKRREAMESLQRSIEVLERMRRQIAAENLRHSFFTDRYDPFKSMVSLLYESSADKGKALEFVDRAKSLTLREHLNQDAVALKPTAAVQETGKSRYSMVEYFWTDDALLIFVYGQNGVETFAQNVSGEAVSGRIQNYLESIRKNDTKGFHASSRLLYDTLIAPVEKSAFAGSADALVILPDGPLHLLPFAGLQDSHGRFLIERVPLAYTPSRSIFQHCLESSRGKTAASRAVLIDGSAGLPNAREELNYLSRLYGRSASVLSPEDAPSFRRAVARSGILHFAGHADNVQGRPALLLQTVPREIRLDARDINTWRMPNVRLANLAGCSTAIGPLADGEGPWGLIPAFLNAGAPSIVASLMPVDDRSTRNLNLRFYDLMQKGTGKARALQQAQLALLESARSGSDPRPQSWIPYVLLGNPQ
ncbi:MAG: CHAT domain-containing protein [Acidobacteriota bacterium]|nr:CHAT domain-containing protein [Acidobacteriota bacterium]